MSQELRRLLIEQMPMDDTVALLLSGGVDSLSCGFAVEAAGCSVHAYTFRINEVPNADVRAASAAAEMFDWPHTIIDVPVDQLEEDFLCLAQEWKCQVKTDFECTWPLLYTVPEIDEGVLISGIGADGLYGMGREAAFNYRDDRRAFDTYRKNYTAGSENQLRMMSRDNGIDAILPYREESVKQYFLRYGWYELNKPKEKMHTLRAFKNQFLRFGRRDHGPYQLIARIPHYFKKLLDSPLNKKDRDRVMDLCHDYGKWDNLP